MKKLLIIPALAAALAIAVANTENTEAPAQEAPAKEEAKTPEKCQCGVAKCQQILSKNKDGVYRYRGCYDNAKKDGKCGKSAQAGGGCGSNCVEVDRADVTDEEEKKKLPPSPCEGCPCAADCKGCVVALLAPKE